MYMVTIKLLLADTDFFALVIQVFLCINIKETNATEYVLKKHWVILNKSETEDKMKC